MSVMGQHEHRRMIRRFGAPPPGPFLIPVPADRAEHVPAHHIRAPRAHEPLLRDLVGIVGSRVADVPAVQLTPPLAQGVLAALVRPGDEAVQRDRHVAGGVRHRNLLSDCDLQAVVRTVAGDANLRAPLPSRAGPTTAERLTVAYAAALALETGESPKRLPRLPRQRPHHALARPAACPA